MLAPWKKTYEKPGQYIKKQRHHFADKIQSSYGLSSRHMWMWDLDHKEDWKPKNWCFWTVVLEKSLDSPLNSKGIKPDNTKGNQCWILIVRTDTEAEAPILGHLMWRADSWEKTWCRESLKAGGKGSDRA